MAGYLQKDHLLRIDTILSNPKLFPQEAQFQGDPLLLAKLDGVEGISRLFAYDIIMLRDVGGDNGETVNGQTRPPIDTTKLIGTHAEIGARPSDSTTQTDDTIVFKRVGMFETFEDLLDIDITHFLGKAKRDFHIYRARVVPWVKVLSRDVCYRVFEGKTVVEIIDAIADEAKKTFIHLKIDTSALKKNPPPHPFTPMEYCVQFGESTLDFLSRLMARFGIWYFFGSNADSGNSVFNADSGRRVLNDVMFLKSSSDNRVSPVGLNNIKIKKEDGPGIREIGKLVRRFRPPERRVAVGGFNYLDPTHPFYKAEAVIDSDDLLRNEGGQASQTKFSGSTSFAQPVFSDPDAAALADSATAQNQSEVLLISGVSKNQSFIPGESFLILSDKNLDLKDNENRPYVDVVDRNFLIDTLVITANDYGYVNLPGAAIPDLFTKIISTLEADALDKTNNAFFNASLWATRTAQAKIYTALNPYAGIFPDTASGLASDVAGALSAGGSAAGGLIGGPVGGILQAADFKRLVTDLANMTVLAVGVVAVPTDAPIDPPLPLATRPVARGPHTAVVIGADDGKGVDTSEHDVFCDAIGRVRVRFPWDPGPPQGGSKIPPIFPFAQSDKPTKVGGNTCWVRVVEDWAGRHYGMQFLPRIGQEVIVDFLDGDPERPVITGRLYNADQGTTNLPFPHPSVKDQHLKNPGQTGPTAAGAKELKDTTNFDLLLSGIKTFSIPTTDGDGKELPKRFHLLRFSDKRDHEQYLIRSQHRLDITAFDKRFESIGSDRHLTVGGKTPPPPGPPTIGGTYFAKIFKHYHLHVGDPEFPDESGNRFTRIEQDDQIAVVQDSLQDIGGNWSTNVGGQMTVNAMQLEGTIVLNASFNITLMVGPSSIVITPLGISITGPVINLVAPAILSTVPVVPVGAATLPPGIPIPPLVTKPTDPTAADPGDTLTPPE
jgi:uncharacterized protein involved in type VI secretion and phage assembly